ncbi:F-box protein [Corchorus olitorius]|uniref:F-box protein n=1 Tax=Corchorus olitorius TaxID=93759 RepID=A0A1R3H3U8_9ROSI|nr:F-box protein [Corchorus olitorius]
MSSKINQDSASADNHQGNKEEEEVIEEDLWGRSLPAELLELILSKLFFVVDIHNFHAVCKTWRSITVSISPPRQLPPPLSYVDSSFPLLIQFMERGRMYSLFHPLYKYTWDMEFPPQVRDGMKFMYFAKYGWSLIRVAQVSDHQYPYLFLFNPLTQEIKKLPTMPMPFLSFCLRESMLFTCPPDSQSSDCSVVAIFAHAVDHSSIYVHKLGQADWKKHDLQTENCLNFLPYSNLILYQGLYYCLDLEGNLGVFDIQDIQHSWIVHHIEHEFLPCEDSSSDDDEDFPWKVSLGDLVSLVEHNGRLLVVYINSGDPDVFELDLERKVCVPLKSLGKKTALFVSRGASFSQRAVVSGTGNKVFGPLVLMNQNGTYGIYDDSFRFYSFTTGKYHSFFDNLSNLYGVKYVRDRSWLPILAKLPLRVVEDGSKKKVRVLELNFLGRGSMYRYPSLMDESFNLNKMAGKRGPQTFSSLTSLCLNFVGAYSESMEGFLSNCPSLERLCLHCVYDLGRLTISDLSLKSTPSLVESSIAGGLNCDKDFILKFSPLFSTSLSQLTKLTLDCEYMQLDFPENFPPLIYLKQLELQVTEYEHQSILPWLDLIEACPMLSRLKMKTTESTDFKGSLEWKAAKESHKSLEVVEIVGFIAFSTAGEFLINLIHNTASLKKIIIDPPKKYYTVFSFINERDFEVEARRFAKERLEVALAPSVEVVIISQ